MDAACPQQKILCGRRYDKLDFASHLEVLQEAGATQQAGICSDFCSDRVIRLKFQMIYFSARQTIRAMLFLTLRSRSGRTMLS